MRKTTIKLTTDQENFLSALHGDCEGLVEFRSFPSANRIITKNFNDLGRFIQDQSAENLHVGVATRKDASNGKLENCQHLGAVFIDIDFKDVPEDEYREKINFCSLPPSMIIHSGHGLHVYWLLKEALDLQNAEDLKMARHLLLHLAKYFRADLNSAEPARVLRLPDTLNHKYSPSCNVKIEYLDNARRYNLFDFDDWLPEESGFYSNSSENSGKIIQGARNATLYRYGRKLHFMGLPENDIRKILHSLNFKRCNPPLADSELAHIAHNVIMQKDRSHFTSFDPVALTSGFNPISAEDLLNSDMEKEVLTYVWEGLLPTGSVGVLTAQPKCGKTTLTFHLAAAVTTGSPFLGRRIKQGNVLIISCEENQNIIHYRLQNLHHNSAHLFLHTGFLKTFPLLYEELRKYILAHSISLVIIDTLGSFWNVEDENSATRVMEALKPILHEARTTNACFLLLHHNRKSGGSAGLEIRGSNAIFAAVDVALILKENGVRTQRAITVQSRYPNAPKEMLVEFRDGEFTHLGYFHDTKQEQKDKVFLHMTEKLTSIKEIASRVELHYSTVSVILKQLREEGKIRKKSGPGRGGHILYARKRPRLCLVPNE